MLLLVAACVENVLHKQEPPPVPVDTSVTDVPPAENCNGHDDDEDGLVDEGFPDTDANGRADCVDGSCDGLEVAPAGAVTVDTSCVVLDPLDDAWSVREMWGFARLDGEFSYTQPVITRLDADGDGALDAAVRVVTVMADAGGSARLVVLDGPTGAELWSAGGPGPYAQLAAADIDNDGLVEILVFDAAGRLLALDGTGGVLWTSEAAIFASEGWQVLVADVDGDSVPEVIADTMVLDGPSGTTESVIWVDETIHPHRAPMVADLDLDGDQEIVVAARAFEVDGTEIWYSGEGVVDMVWSATAQFDADPEAEVLFLGANMALTDTDGSLLIRAPVFSRTWEGGPCIGDFDGDGASEFAYVAYDAFYVRNLDASQVWDTETEGTTGMPMCAGYDLDVDGALELILADDASVRILAGRTGEELWVSPPRASFSHWQGPALGDLDGDGDIEVLVPDNDPSHPALMAYTHDGVGWPATTSVWPVSDYAVWNVEDDGGVPPVPDAPWLLGNGVRTAPVNPRYAPAPDLRVSVSALCVADCTYGPVAVAVQVENAGGIDVPAGAVLSLHATDGTQLTLLESRALPAVASGERLEAAVFEVTPSALLAGGFVATVDDAFLVEECDETNRAEALLVCP